MAIGTLSDFKIYNEEFFGGFNEVVQQNSGIFNGVSSNTMRLVPKMLKGEFERESFFKAVETLVSHRDPTSTSTVTPQKLEQGEMVGVKLNRKIGPAEQTMDAFKKIQIDPREFSFVLGQQAGEEALRDYVNTGALAVSTAIATRSDLVTSALTESVKKLRAEYLIRAMAKMGDRSQRVRAWVMHSKPWFDLMEGQVADKVTNIADVVIYGGAPGTLGRPVIVTDSPYLINNDSDGDPENYMVLGLTEDAVVMNQSEEETILSDTVLGKENIIMQYQGEYAYNLRVKGFAYDGSANPNDSALGNPVSWNYLMHDVKLGPGVLLLVE
jgi:hypothetical protein